MVKILVTDGMENAGLSMLKDKGFKVDEQFYEHDDLCEKVKEYDAIVVRSATKIRKDVIDAAVEGGNLKLIIRAGVGLDNIDVDYAKQNGIEVRNTPNASSISVAELTIGQMIAVSRYIHLANVTMREGKWEKKKYKGVELYGKTLGLIGFGRIARKVAERAEAFGMKILYNDIVGECKGYENYKYCELDEIFKSSDYISLHIPLDKHKDYVIGKEQLDMMKDGAFLINIARGGLINEDDLVEALDSGKLAGVCLDVFENEPPKNTKLINNPKVCETPHIGGSTIEAQSRISEEVASIIIDYFS